MPGTEEVELSTNITEGKECVESRDHTILLFLVMWLETS